eukprot:6189259-Pleurochrysis_carterae.AAC.1
MNVRACRIRAQMRVAHASAASVRVRTEMWEGEWIGGGGSVGAGARVSRVAARVSRCGCTRVRG